MHDADLVKRLFTKTMYNRLYPHIKEHAVSECAWSVLTALGKYYKSYPHVEDVVFDDFKKFFFILYSSAKADKTAMLVKFFDTIESSTGGGEVLEDVLKSLVTKDYATQVYQTAMKVVTGGTETMEDVSNLMTSYSREVGKVVSHDDLFVSTSIEDVLKECEEGGFEWRLEELNRSIGPLRSGDFIILAARPETGKTTFCAAEVSYFLDQTPVRPIMWVNNEERGNKVMFRIMQAYFGVTYHDLKDRWAEYKDIFDKRVGKKLRLLNDDVGMTDIKHLSALFEEHNPCMIVFDQLDKVHGFSKAEREDLRIGHLYEWARSLAKKYGVVVAVSQADGSAEGEKYIEMNQLRGSKTDKVGEADCIITIGKGSEEYARYINVPKNKLFGGPRTDASLRHGKWEVQIQPEIARYKGVF